MDWNVFFEIHQDLPKQGPGSDQDTRDALCLLTNLSARPRILDVGCGPGRQSMVLARETKGHITAIDTHEPFLEQLDKRAKTEGLSASIKTKNHSMMDLEALDAQFDLIWSEAAIYNIGFAKGLQEWKKVLKPKGYLCVSEISWLMAMLPDDLKQYWQENYPAIQSLSHNVETIKEQGYSVINFFTLPTKSWWDDYYTPIEQRLPELRVKYANNKEARETIEAEQKEIDLFRTYAAYYGYVFFVLQNQ